MWHTVHTEEMHVIPKVPDWRGSYLVFFSLTYICQDALTCISMKPATKLCPRDCTSSPVLDFHDALEYVLASNVADYRDADHSARRLLQVADYICTVERAALAYGHGTPT